MQSGRPVTPQTVFRIASRTKNFTALAALQLRDAGRLSLDAPVEAYVHRARRWSYPTSDSPKITVRDLLGHTGGFVTDDPWGDRQLDWSPEQFNRFLDQAPPLATTPDTSFEYSNFGYALLGRVVESASGRDYAPYMRERLLGPLGMRSSTFEVRDVPPERRTVGYRREEGRWREEPVLSHGAFGPMGGLLTTAEDYARYVAFMLDAWPSRSGPEHPVLKRSSVRETARANSFLRVQRRPPPERSDPTGCDAATAYGMGLIAQQDCRLGQALMHGGGLPGYGSYVLMLPERGVGVFAFSNGTYAPAILPVRSAARALVDSGAFPVRPAPASAGVRAMQEAAARIYAASDVSAAGSALANNVLLDRDARTRNAELAKLRAELGACSAVESVEPRTAMQAQVTWRCERGRLRAHAAGPDRAGDAAEPGVRQGRVRAVSPRCARRSRPATPRSCPWAWRRPSWRPSGRP